MPPKIRSNEASDVRRRVDMKIFELQSLLLYECDEATLEESIKWLHPRHFEEIFEERVSENKCVNLLCDSEAGIDGNFCSDKCFDIASLTTKRFDESVPYSREIVDTLDFETLKKRDIHQILSLLDPEERKDDRSARKAAQKEKSASSAALAPMYSSTAISSTGELNVNFEKGVPVMSEPNKPDDSVPKSTSHIKSILKKKSVPATTTKGSIQTDKSTKQVSIVTPDSEVLETPSGVVIIGGDVEVGGNSLEDLFKTMQSIQRKHVVPSNGANDQWLEATHSISPSEDSVEDTSKALRDVNWIDPSNIPSPRSLKVEDQSGGMPMPPPVYAPPTKSKSVISNSSSKGKKNANKPAVESKTNSLVFNNQYTVVERIDPGKPLTEAGMMLKQEVPQEDGNGANSASGSIEGYKPSVNFSSVIADERLQKETMEAAGNKSLRQSGDHGGQTSIFIKDASEIRIAPVTAVGNLSYDPFQQMQKERSDSSDDEESDHIEDEGEDSYKSDSEMKDNEMIEMQESSEGPGSTSLFLTIWTALDDIFPAHVQISAGSEQTQESAEEKDPTVRMPIATENQAIEALQTLLERGTKTAENLLHIQRVLSKRESRVIYQREKANIMSSISKRNIKSCPSLRSAGWVLVGLLIIDGSIMRHNLISDEYLEEWSVKIDSIAAAALGGGEVASTLLRADDMKILRSFFNRMEGFD